MNYFLKLGQFLPSVIPKRMTSTIAQIKLIPLNKHSSTVMNVYIAYIYILSSMIIYTHSHTPVKRYIHNSLPCLLEV